jgi:hypothetical protein
MHGSIFGREQKNVTTVCAFVFGFLIFQERLDAFCLDFFRFSTMLMA